MAAAGGLTRAAGCRFLQLLKESGRGSLLVKSNSCISTSASVLGSSWATKWSFLSSHQSLDFFFASSQSQDTVRNVNGFCFFMLSPHVLLSSEAK